MPCFEIQYRDRYGPHSATKWGETPALALAALKRAHDIPGRGAAEYARPALVVPQPFADFCRDQKSPAVAQRAKEGSLNPPPRV